MVATSTPELMRIRKEAEERANKKQHIDVVKKKLFDKTTHVVGLTGNNDKSTALKDSRCCAKEKLGKKKKVKKPTADISDEEVDVSVKIKKPKTKPCGKTGNTEGLAKNKKKTSRNKGIRLGQDSDYTPKTSHKLASQSRPRPTLPPRKPAWLQQRCPSGMILAKYMDTAIV
jgi:hypothetical protein